MKQDSLELFIEIAVDTKNRVINREVSVGTDIPFRFFRLRRIIKNVKTYASKRMTSIRNAKHSYDARMCSFGDTVRII